MRNAIIPAAYLVLLKNDQVLLLRRVNTGYQDGKYSLIAGHVEQGETFTDCIIREAAEEAGIILKAENLQVGHVMHRDSGERESNERMDIFFVSTEWSGDVQNMEPHKCDDLAWFSLASMPTNAIPYVADAIAAIKNKTLYSENGWK
jgi:8-oxo-dGTP pyrophosphatase MutT (NUDIX family)